MGKTATERLNAKKQPKKVVLEKDFAGIKAGTRMLVGTPQMVDNYVRKIPFGETRTIPRLRNELARRHRCDAMCPVSTAIFLRVVADAALESLEAGSAIADVTPFWRAVAPDDKLVKKLDVDSAWIEHQRALEC
ncbi:MAG: hypothetical protein AAGC71_18245 [Pseudomonadota bacterium]